MLNMFSFLKQNMFLLSNSFFFQIVFLVETLKGRSKNVLDGFTRCLKELKATKGQARAT